MLAPVVTTCTVSCARCGELIGVVEDWDLGHDTSIDRAARDRSTRAASVRPPRNGSGRRQVFLRVGGQVPVDAVDLLHGCAHDPRELEEAHARRNRGGGERVPHRLGDERRQAGGVEH